MEDVQTPLRSLYSQKTWGNIILLFAINVHFFIVSDLRMVVPKAHLYFFSQEPITSKSSACTKAFG